MCSLSGESGGDLPAQPSQTPHQTASIPSHQERPSLSSPLKHKPRCLPQPCSSTQRPSRKDTGPNWDLLVEHVGPVQPGEHSHSNPREVSLQLPLLWQGSDRQACSAAKTRRQSEGTPASAAYTLSRTQVPHLGRQLKGVPENKSPRAITPLCPGKTGRHLSCEDLSSHIPRHLSRGHKPTASHACQHHPQHTSDLKDGSKTH